jgi:hypothetical protein
MSLKEIVERFLPKKEKTSEEFLELEELPEEMKINVRVETLNSFSDSEKIQQFLREGNVIFLRIRDLREKDITELKRVVDRLRKTCMAVNGDIVGVDEDYLILAPSFARIYRGK